MSRTCGALWLGNEPTIASRPGCFDLHGALAAPRYSASLDKAGGVMTNIQRPGGLGKDPDRASRRAAPWLDDVVPGVSRTGAQVPAKAIARLEPGKGGGAFRKGVTALAR
ncbi:hypothetical protein ACFWSF_33555 [Streptomyces sp. NPDC058611]|uniref:hypothetical protein n=1 Tax=unclassified Streptomyces TaxID=2593676 RepID=UPI0036669F55